jgi:hypothetical protein
MRDGMLQPVRTNGEALELHGQPFRERPEVTGRTGAPMRVVTAEFVPAGCRCSWAYVHGRLTLKYSSTACPLLRDHQTGPPEPRAAPLRSSAG